MEKLIVIGHQNPDTDSVVSTIVWSEYLRKKGMKAKPALAGKLNKETKLVLILLKEKRLPVLKTGKNKKLFLIDHGDLTQAIPGIKEKNIVGVLDHHRMAGLSTSHPIFYRCQPLGSTSTLLAKIFEENNLNLTKRQASLLVAGLISDTLNLTSVTTTKEDRRIFKKLKEISPIDIDRLTQKMFKAKSDISGLKIEEILTKDYKTYFFGGKKVGIGVWETTAIAPFEKIKTKIFQNLAKLKTRDKLDFLFFGVVDILNKKTQLYLSNLSEKKLAERAFKKKYKEENIMILPKVVSRKKQLVPPLVKALEKGRI